MRHRLKYLVGSILLTLSTLALHAQCWQKTSEGIFHTLAVKPDGTLWAWGGNASGQLGDGTNTTRTEPIQIGTSTDWDQVSAGGNFSLAIKKDGTLWAWGDNLWGQLGLGSYGNQTNTPAKVGTSTNWKSVSAGRTFTLAIKTDGTLWAWGDNLSGQLGNQIYNAYSPRQVGAATNWKSVAAGGIHTLAIKTDGSLWAWGYNSSGQLGDGTTTDRLTPVRVGTASDWTAVSAGFTFSVALKANGSLWAWGQNDLGQLGDGTYNDRNAPAVVGTANWKSMTAGSLSTFGVRADGTLWSWGYIIGKWGATPENSRAVPTQIGSASSWDLVTAGESHAFAFQTDGSLWGWGDNGGNLGIGNMDNQLEPVWLIPSVPVAEATQYICNAGTIANLKATGTDIQWYSATSGGVPLSASTPLVSGAHYYGSQTKYMCESNRVDVVAIINTVPTAAPSGSSTQYYCSGSTLENLVADGTFIQWYATALSTQPLATSTPLVNGQHYFATQTIQGCESTTRLNVTVVERTTSAPTGQTFQKLCAGSTIANLVATGTQIKWYDEYLHLLPPSTILVDEKTYYGSQTINSNESCQYLPVTVDVMPIPDAPWGEHYQSFCKPSTVANLGAVGDLIRWYDQPTGGTPLSPFDNIVHGKHYYASQSIDYSFACESPRMDVLVSINSYDVPGAGGGYQTLCAGSTIADIAVSGQNVKWYATSENGAPLPPETVLVDNGYYYGSQTINNVESCFRNTTVVSINTTPSNPPVSAGDQVFCDAAMVSSLSASGTNIKWYETVNSTSSLASSSPLVQKNYYATQTIGGCESKDRLVVPVTINTNHPPTPSGSSSQFTCGGKVMDLQASGTAIQWYASPTSNTPLAPTTQLIDGTHYYATQTVNTCSSLQRFEVTADVDPETPWPTIDSDQRWQVITTGYGNFTLGIKAGRLWGWGQNEVGQLANGTTVNEDEPTLVDSKPQWKSVTAGSFQALGLKTDGTLWEWGERQPGDGTVIINKVPVQIGNDSNWKTMASGSWHSLAIRNDGTLWSWGFNIDGELGVGGAPELIKNEPVQIGNDADWVSVSAGWNHSVALKSDGSIWAWGSYEAQNGYPWQTTPRRFGNDNDWVYVSDGPNSTYAIKADGSLWELVRSRNTWELPHANRIGTDADWMSISIRSYHVIARKKDGSLWGWMSNRLGELGNGEYYETSDVLRQVLGGSDWTDVVCSDGRYSFAIKNDGSLWGWGNNDAHQLGIAEGPPNYNTPQPIISPEVAPFSLACGIATLDELAIVGQSIQWYSTATGNQQLSESTAVGSGAHYFVTQTQGVCESRRKEVIAVSTDLGSPVGSALQIFCEGATVSDLVAVGTSVEWYDVATGGIPLAPSVPLQSGAHYYSAQTLTNCESSDRFEVAVTVNANATTTPIGNSSQSFCVGSTVRSLVAAGDNLKWYASASGGEPLTLSTPLVNNEHYFVSQTVNACESTARLDVKATVHQTSAPVGPAEQSYCGAVALSDMTITGSEIKLYTTPTGGTAWDPTRPVFENGHYYASQTLNGCESHDRLDVNVTINHTQEPHVSGQQTICFSGTVADLVASGQNLKWYDNSSGGTPLDLTTPLTSKYYYVSQTINNCESTYRSNQYVNVIEDLAPTVNPSQVFCTGGIVNNLQWITGGKWYDTETGGTPLAASTPLINGKYYYGSQTIGPCESTKRAKVLVTLAGDVPPSGSASQSVCSGARVADLVATGGFIKWYETETGGTALDSYIALINGKSYYASQTVEFCESRTRFKTTVTIAPKSPLPTAPSPQYHSIGSVVGDLQATGKELKWYDNFPNAQYGMNPLPVEQLLNLDWTYYVTQNSTGCTSDVRVVEVLVLITAVEPDVELLGLYPNPAKTILNVSSAKVVQTITVINNFGQPVITKAVNDRVFTIDLSSLPGGEYYLELQLTDARIFRKVTKQ